jgi:hypothetical protein
LHLAGALLDQDVIGSPGRFADAFFERDRLARGSVGMR